ncbi:MAG: NMD3-related protein [Candidatus Anstonellaceae archaeon]
MQKIQKCCPKCGKDSSAYNFENDFCLEHFLENFFNSIHLKKIRIKRCTQCNKFKIFYNNNKDFLWVEKNNKKFLFFLLEKLNLPPSIFKKISIEKLEKNILKLKIEDKVYELILNLGFEDLLCKNCKEKSKSYSSIIQLRGDSLKIQEFYLFLKKLLDQENIKIFKVQELKEGKNLYVDKKEELVLLFSRNKIKFVRTSKLVGQKRDGKRIFLDTFLIKV